MPASPVVVGLACVAAAGSVWSVAGLIMGLTSRRGIPPHHLIAASTAVSIVGSLAVLVDHRQLLAGNLPEHLGWLCAAMLASGLLVSIGTQALMRGMRTGHQGSCWTIAQSALVVPYLLGLAVWGSPHSWLRSLGVILVLAALILLGLVRERRASGGPGRGTAWFWYSLFCFGCFGLQQFLMTWPSTWPGWEEPVGMRPTLVYLGLALGAWVPVAAQRRLPQRRVLPLAAVLGSLSVLGQLALFNGLDRLGAAGLANLGFPVAVGLAIAGFAVFSLAVLREPAHPLRLAGLTLVLGGIVVLAVGGVFG